MEQILLTAQKRTILGKKVKKLRKEGLIPAHVFGHKVKTIHVQVKASDFAKVFGKVGETSIVDLTIDGSSTSASKNQDKRPVLIRNVQLHPVSDLPLHVDFYQVNLTEKVKVDIPLEVVGSAPAIEKKVGLLLTPVSEIEIEALPTDLPEKLEVNVSSLENVSDEIKLKDLIYDKSKITIHADSDLVVAQIGELVTKEMEAVEAEIEAEKVAVEEAAVEEVPAVEAEAAAEEAAAEAKSEAKEEKPREKSQESAPKQEEKSK